MRKSAFLVLLALLATAAPSLAGQLFVPVAGHHTVDGRVTYRTRVWVTNLGAAGAPAALRFVALGTDGTAAAARAAAAAVVVPAGGTVLLGDVAPAGISGMLEVDGGGAEVAVSARLEAVDASGRVLSSAAVQAVAAADAVPAGAQAHLQGLVRRVAGEVTDVALLNLSQQAASCSVAAYRADGSLIASAAWFSLPPLGAGELADAYGRLGVRQIADARLAASCDQPFYAYATIVAAGGAIAAVVTPSRGATDLPAAGAAPAAGGGTAGAMAAPAEPSAAAAPDAAAVTERAPAGGGAVTLSVPGTFLHATDSNSFASYDLATRPGVAYHRATVDFDLSIGRFNNVLLFTGVTSFRRPARHRKDRVLYYAMQLVNRNQKTVLDLGIQDRIARTQGPWQPGHTYHLKFTYDLRNRLVQLDVYEHGGHIYKISGPALHFDLSANGNPLTVDFGQTGIGDGAYGPPLGWDYANLNVLLEP